MDKKIQLLEIFFKYLRITLGVVITFYEFNYGTPFNEIITVIGLLIILTSGIKVAFTYDQSTVVKPG
ncbi:hypothetical protein CMI42_00925 [Candidatus Pacearchaeota archaeon]|nr:hypothetical protein [Candidatus Pacearchaeota archaeon]